MPLPPADPAQRCRSKGRATNKVKAARGTPPLLGPSRYGVGLLALAQNVASSECWRTLQHDRLEPAPALPARTLQQIPSMGADQLRSAHSTTISKVEAVPLERGGQWM